MKRLFFRLPSQRGLTVIELLVAVAIVGILVAIALPAYRESVARARRADARVALGGLAIAMERYFSLLTPADLAYSSGYLGAASSGVGSAPKPGVFASRAPLDGAVKYYDLVIAAADATGFTLHAVPIRANWGNRDDRCGTFTLTSTGKRGLAGVQDTTPPNPLVADCWR